MVVTNNNVYSSIDEPERYIVSDIVNWLHDFPHVDLSFREINDTFAPRENRYRESLYFLSAIPVVWLVLTFITLAVFMCCRCCWCATNKTRKNSQKLTCLNWAIAILVLMCSILLALSFYGNEQVDEGMRQVITSLHNVNKTIDEAAKRVDILDASIKTINGSGITNIEEIVDSKVPNRTIRELIHKHVLTLHSQCDSAKHSIDVIKTDAASIHLDRVTDITRMVEFYRWIGTIVILCLVVMVCLGFLLGVVKRSRGILIATIVMSIVAIFLVFAAAGVYLGVNVGASDFCVKPDDFIERQAPKTVQPLLRQYIDCTEDPFSGDITSATTGLSNVNTTISTILTLVQPFHIEMLTTPVEALVHEVRWCMGNLTRLGGVVGCTGLHTDYINALYGLCDKSMLGLVFIMMSCFVIGIAASIMICLVSTAWRHYGKSKDRYESDDSDPFLPRPPPYNGYGAIPAECVASVHGDTSRVDVRLSNRSSLDLGLMREYAVNGTIQPGGSPPPAYSHNRGRQISYRRVHKDEGQHWSDQIHPAADLDYTGHGTFNR